MDFQHDLGQLFPLQPPPSSPSSSSVAPGGGISVVRVGNDMLPQDLVRSAIHFRNLASIQQKISEIIDRMGELSAVAQGLKGQITSGEKVRNHPEHSVYLLIDRQSNGGMGSVVGLLKVGKKNLFLLDRRGEQNEVKPMCILDFYIHESRQRSGCGRQLFEHMLRDQEIHPSFMAIDRPSPKLLAFLGKYYDLSAVIPQVNNYVIFDGFFSSNNNLVECAGEGVKRPRIYMGKLQYV